MTRRKVDWSVTLGTEASRIASSLSPSFPSGLMDKLACARLEPTARAADELIREAVVTARQHLKLERVAVFLLDEQSELMMGTWGTAADGSVSDEHDIQYSVGGMDREVFENAAAGVPWSVFEDCPRMAHDDGASFMLRRDWVVCTALMVQKKPLGIVFSDGGKSEAPIDLEAQSRLWLLSSLIAPSLVPAVANSEQQLSEAVSPLVKKVRELLEIDRGLTGEEISAKIGVSPTKLAREFRRDTGQTFVAYRNDLRLEHFFHQVRPEGANLLEAALAAGFGSYAQFHRVFRGRFGHAPKKYFAAHAGFLAGDQDKACKK